MKNKAQIIFDKTKKSLKIKNLLIKKNISSCQITKCFISPTERYLNIIKCGYKDCNLNNRILKNTLKT